MPCLTLAQIFGLVVGHFLKTEEDIAAYPEAAAEVGEMILFSWPEPLSGPKRPGQKHCCRCLEHLGPCAVMINSMPSKKISVKNYSFFKYPKIVHQPVNGLVGSRCALAAVGLANAINSLVSKHDHAILA
jgi:hypothetical protein